MSRHIKKYLIATLLATCLAAGCTPEEPLQPDEPSVVEEPADETEAPLLPDASAWVATDAQGNSIDPDEGLYPSPEERQGKKVAIFYFLWHGCHGYDRPTNYNRVVAPSASDVRSPYDIQKLLDSNPSAPALGDYGVMHHWGEPYLGYYVSDDEWVIRKHAQMLSDAGVDAIFFDVTNGFHYLPVVRNLAEIYTSMRAQGNKTPQFAFLLNSSVANMSTELWEALYSAGQFQDLWFCWDGKPLMLANPDEVPEGIRGHFTLRRSWFLFNKASSDGWFGSGEDKWPWGAWYPQQAGRHNGKNECVSVMPATHPTSGIGRSYDVSTGTEPPVPTPGKGIYFKKQFERAMDLDPQLIFFTGWNEWTAQRQRESSCPPPYFVDQYNHEFSRDIEPLNGDFGDNYYYMMADFIRKFKGAGPLPAFGQRKSISIDGDFSDWKGVSARWADDLGDICHRDWFGWGRLGQLTNDTGRNDIILTKVVNDGACLYFYVKTASDLSPCTDERWMQLFLRVNGAAKNWEGYDFVVNRTVPAPGRSLLEKSDGGWAWKEAAEVKFAVTGNEMEIAVPFYYLGIKDAGNFTIDFKWVDNAAAGGDIQTCMRDGDSAPNGRFRYRYKFLKQSKV